jgi:hypothetical protein
MIIFDNTNHYMKRIIFYLALLITVFLYACNDGSANKPKSSRDAARYAAESVISPDSVRPNFPLLTQRLAAIRAALAKPIPVLLLANADSTQAKAQQTALTDGRFTENLFDKKSKQPFFNEIFSIYKARPQEIPKGYSPATVYRVELYNYALNLTTVALTDIATQKVLSVSTFPQTQPDLNAALTDLATQIAVHSTEVAKALGYTPGEKDALMAATKTSLNRTKCERSMHLCVAPTFIKNDKALWAIVDLTDLRLVGIRWTNVGTTGPVERISERKLQFEKIMECNCKTQKAVEKNGWKMNYILTSSDGLRISEVYFNNKLVMHNAKLVDWHVNYSNTDGFGYSDAVGCPEFSQAAVVAVTEPRISELVQNGGAAGFVLEQEFRSEQWPSPCNYSYVQRYEFYNDGSFRVAAASLGRGCGNDGTYRPVTRICFAGEQNNFSEWATGAWQPWLKEQWQLQSPQTTYTSEGYQYKITDAAGNGYYLEPGNGQFKDGGRGDNAYVYVTKLDAARDEGETDLVTIGPCCNTDYRQGPEKFIEPAPESIQNSKLVVWYVPKLKNDNTAGKEYCWAESYLENGVYKTKTFPCFSGPKFIPVNNSQGKTAALGKSLSNKN